MSTRRIIGVAALLLTGCAVGPDYAPPSLDARTGERWIDATPADAASVDLAAWWRSFDDPELAALVDAALADNIGLAEARERIVAARARRGIRNAERLPTLDGEALYRRTERGPDAPRFGPAGIDDADDEYSLGVVAGWELDLWGRVGRLVEAADLEIEVAIEDERAARVLLAAEAARELLAIRALDEEIAIVRRAIALDAESLEIASLRFAAGFAGELEVLQARRERSANEALLPGLEAERRAAEFRLATLLGDRPGQVSVAVRALPAPPPMPALGLPADLLTRRPDIRAAERRLAAATARVGSAKAERYPRVGLSGTFTLSGSDIGDIVDLDTRTFGIGPTIVLPILDGGRIASGIELAESDARAELLRLESSVLDAVREVETTLARRRRVEDRIAALAAAASAAKDAERLARELYAAGTADFLNVLDAQARLLEIDSRLLAALRERLVLAVDLYAALGGGWNAAPPSERAEEGEDRLALRTR